MDSNNENISQLRRRLAALVADLPEMTQLLRGTLGERLVSCGKKGCRCQDGHKHGPVYFLSVSQGRGHTLQLTLSKEAYEQAQRLAANWARLEEILEEISRINRELLRLDHSKPLKRQALPER